MCFPGRTCKVESTVSIHFLTASKEYSPGVDATVREWRALEKKKETMISIEVIAN